MFHDSMEQKPVRRRRRRRRTSAAQRETVAWLTYFFSLGRRVFRWVGLVLLLAFILALGLGAPIGSLENLLSFWGHW